MKPIRAVILARFIAALICASQTPPANAFTIGINISYNHGVDGRLRSVSYGGSSNSTFTYDSDGNLLARNESTNPFIPVAGAYTGLVLGGTLSSLNTGTVALTVSAGGSFTGALILGGVKYSITGSFDPSSGELTAPILIHRKAPLADITLDLTIDLKNGTGEVSGTISGGESAAITALYSPFNKKSNPLPGGLAGLYTAFFQTTGTGSTIPFGYGYGTVAVGEDGSVKLAGVLPDGTKVSQGATLDENATCPLFIGLYKNSGFIDGSIEFSDIPGVSDFSGTLTWLKPTTAGPIYPAAFNVNATLLGSKYTAPLPGRRVLNFSNASPDAVFSAVGGNLPDSPSDSVTLNLENKIVGPLNDALKLHLSITTSSGLFSGSFFDSATHSFNGVIFQRQNLGLGLFPGSSETGQVTLESAP